MKILHTADWHLGAYVGPQCDSPIERMKNTMLCLDKLVEIARAEQPDIILVAGDVFHAARVWSDRALTEVRVAADYINLLSQFAPVAVLYGTPNHDGIEQFKTLQSMAPGIIYFTKPGIKTMLTNSGRIQVAGLPGLEKGHFRAEFPGLSAEEENKVFSEQLAGIVQGLSAELEPSIPSVLMAHHTVVGAEYDSGQHIFQANEIVLPASCLVDSAFDLVCLGHIHKAQRVDMCKKPVYYSGSIDAFTFNDEGNDKGFWIYDIDDNRFITSGFKPTPHRKFQSERWIQEEVNTYISGEPFTYPEKLKDKVVRVLYTCDSETEKALDKKSLERDLYVAGAYYVSEIRQEKVTATVNREGMTEKLTVSECLHRYLIEKGKTENEITAILSEAADIITDVSASMPMGGASGIFLPVEIEVRNYRSYAEEIFNFTDIYFAMVNGRNGSGKSSLFMDAITDCLYEKTRENELTGWIRNGEKSGSIMFTFQLGADTWRVTRTRQRSGKATLALAKQNSEEWQDHSAERFVDTQQKIIDLLGMDHETFQSCVLIMQDQYGKFMEASKDDRMAVLANLLGLGIYDDLLKTTREKLTDANREVRTTKTDICALEEAVTDEEGLHAERLQVETELMTAKGDLEERRKTLGEIQAQLGALAGQKEDLSRLKNDVAENNRQQGIKKERFKDLNHRLQATKTFLQDEEEIISKCAEMDKARLEMAALESTERMWNDKRNHFVRLNRELLEVQSGLRRLDKKIAEIGTLDDADQLQQLVNELDSIPRELAVYGEKADKYNELENAKYKLRIRIDSLTGQTGLLEDTGCIDIERAKCRFLLSAKEAEKELEKIDVQLRSVIGEIDELAYHKDWHEKLIADAKRYTEAREALARIAADAATLKQLEIQKAESTKRNEHIDAEMKALSKEIAGLGNDVDRINGLDHKIQELKKYEMQKEQLSKAKQFVETTTDNLKQLESDIEDLSRIAGEIGKRIAELIEKLANKSKLEADKSTGEVFAKKAEAIISTANQRIGTIEAELKIIAAKKAEIATKRGQLEKAAKLADALEVLVQAFGQDGIPYQIIRDIVPELEAAANEILSQMTGGRMRLEFVTEKVLKSNKAKEVATLEIIITDVDNGVLPYLSRSGGQKVRAALAVNFALANIKASRVGLQLGMMFVDEPPFLDADGVEAYCTALMAQHNKFPEMRILAISHDENMKSQFAQQIYIETTDTGSKVRR